MLSGFTSGDVGLVLCPIDYDHSKHGVVGQVLIPHDGFSRGEVDSLNAMICRSLAVKCRGWGDSYFADFDLLHQAASLSPARFLSSPRSVTIDEFTHHHHGDGLPPCVYGPF